MRIALFHNLHSGGAKRAVFEWTRRLVKDHDIDVYTLSEADHNFCDIRPFVKQHYIFDFVPRKLFLSPWGRLNQVQRWHDLYGLLEIGQRIANKIDAETYDVVFAHTCWYTHAPTFLQFILTPTVYYLHEPFGRQFARPILRYYSKENGWRKSVDHVDPLIRLYQSRLEIIQRNCVKRVDLLLANSRFTQERIQVAFEVNAQVCHLGVDTETFRPADMEKGDFVLSVGELSARKGFDFIVTSLGLIPENQRPGLKLACNMIIPQEQAYVLDLAKKNNVELEILKNLDTEALAVEYNRAQLCVYAPVMEPLGLVALEAMACGTPVVGVAEGGILETVFDGLNGRLVNRDPVQFGRTVQELLTKPNLRRQLGQQARNYVLRNWTWERSVAEVEQYLWDTANQNRFSTRKSVENDSQGK